MESRKSLKKAGIVILLLAIIFSLPKVAKSYDNKESHPALTEISAYEAIRLGLDIPTDFVAQMKIGADAEDANGRFFHHFYDYKFGDGLNSFFLGGEWESAKEWAQDELLQSAMNRTWEEALRKYKDGDRDLAFLALGHILHLIQDMTVPEHTRNDPHVGVGSLGSAFEDYVKEKGVEIFAKQCVFNFPRYKNLGEYFRYVSGGTGKHFVSADTVFVKKYGEPNYQYLSEEKISKERKIYFGWHVNEEDYYRLVSIVQSYDFFSGETVPRYEIVDPDGLVLNDYADRLVCSAINSSVGIIKLFFRELGKDIDIEIKENIKADLDNIITEEVDNNNKVQDVIIKKATENDGQVESLKSKYYYSEPISKMGGAYLPWFREIDLYAISADQRRLTPNGDEVIIESVQETLGESSNPATTTEVCAEDETDEDLGDEVVEEEVIETEKGIVHIEPTLLSGTITVDTELVATNSPYVITGHLRIANGKRLYIPAGTVIKFKQYGGIIVEGTIISDGKSGAPVVFTSYYDDDYGGDTDEMGVCTETIKEEGAVCPKAGDWHGIEISASGGDSRIDWSLLRYGGYSGSGMADSRFMVRVADSSPEIRNSTVEHSYGHLIYLTRSSALIEGNILRDSEKNLSLAAIYVARGEPIIRGNQVSDNRLGMVLYVTEAIVENNIFSQSNLYPVSIGTGFTGYLKDNSGFDNAINGICIDSAIATKGMTTTLKNNPGLPYHLYIAPASTMASSTLIVEPGVVVKFGSYNFNISGDLQIEGTADSPVVITSLYDDRVATGGINLLSSATSKIRNTIFSYLKKAIHYSRGEINLSGVTFKHNNLGIEAPSDISVALAEDVIFIDNNATSTVDLGN